MREGLTEVTGKRDTNTETMMEETMELETLINVPQAARMLCLSEATIRKWVQLKSIPYQKMGRAVRFSPPVLRAWLAKRSVMSQEDHGKSNEAGNGEMRGA
jgi:excisionase family DNA binding protein